MDARRFVTWLMKGSKLPPHWPASNWTPVTVSSGLFRYPHDRSQRRNAGFCVSDRRENVKLPVLYRFSSWLVIADGDSFCSDAADEYT
jgi:hypothetical protein